MHEDRWAQVLTRAERLLTQLEAVLPKPRPAPDWGTAFAFHWRRRDGHGGLEEVRRLPRQRLHELRNVERQKALLVRNTQQFLHGLPANNCLLWGSRGTGKSSLVKALLAEYAGEGLRLIEVDKRDLEDLPDIVEAVQDRPERYVLFCDDLSFEADDASYKSLKAALDGSLNAPADNLLIYATSNRRHLLPEYHSDNELTRNVDGEIHHGEAVEEKISLSERFGLWVSFHPFDQTAYLDIVFAWLEQLGITRPDVEAVGAEALRYALGRGSRSGRVAWQFAKDYAGRSGLAQDAP